MRLVSIDFLRGLAVSLVLFRHFGIIDWLSDIGWSGVDLFFVLSGFLVSGILFSEYTKSGTIKPMRFLIRRGLKIYPLFYLFILLTTVKSLAVYLLSLEGNKNFSLSGLLSELFFVQNYFDGLWAHTWSLAVEEHFYLLLILIITTLLSIEQLKNFGLFFGLWLIVAVGSLLLRVNNHLTQPFTIDTHMFYTHLRIDSLFFGVLLSYLYHFKKGAFNSFLEKYRWVIGAIGVICLSIMFFFPLQSFVMNTVGLTATYIGYGALLLLCLKNENYFLSTNNFITKTLTKSMAFIGYYSYSIYLFHLAVLVYLIEPFFKHSNNEIAFLLYALGSIVVGVAASRLIEKPVLRFRNNRFPQLSA